MAAGLTQFGPASAQADYPTRPVKFIVPFGAGAAPDLPIGRSYTGDYVWHCHILEHEDNDMMQRYRIV